jgi:hypothetical protein
VRAGQIADKLADVIPLPAASSFPAMIPSIWNSVEILFVLIAVFAGSWIMFWLLAHRSTLQRHWVALDEWGRDRGMYLQSCTGLIPPPPLDAITIHRIEMRVCLRGRRSQLLQAESFHPAGGIGVGEAPLPAAGTWNMLVREIQTAWPATGLRPTAIRTSFVDLFSLTSYPLLGASERFVVHGTDSRAAAALARSSARGLLPPDIGLMLVGHTLLLDFSERPFDTIEFERMIAVADQIISHLPPPDSTQ